MTDGDLSVGYAWSKEDLLAAYNRQHPDAAVAADFEEFMTFVDSGALEKWVDPTLEAFWTKKHGKRVRFAFQEPPALHMHFHVETSTFFLGFYRMMFRCNDGQNSADKPFEELNLSPEEKSRLDAAAAALGLAPQKLIARTRS
ncbi:unnamed protein product [Effrenium voratum]|uniref:Uncharacterized protein n=1 Tax=Effrenium voratum TaxID=2562239 RepID=A0AA36J6R3_9DINO|nr:unnamed protein product [Effrenium voratum]CAJ1458308.1 unnamed protein product [Effrenium voratum]